jgi:hypothetical protein
MWKGIVKVRPGARLGDIGHAIQSFAEHAGFSVVREFCGHGVGARFHEEPQVLHYGRPGTLETLVPGMIFTIEPMINAGKRDIKEDRKGNRPYDGWTIVTRDRSLSAQWEHTVLVTETGYEVLTVSRQPATAGLCHRWFTGRPGRWPPRPEAQADARIGTPARPPISVAALRAGFRDGKAALLQQFRDARATRRPRRTC